MTEQNFKYKDLQDELGRSAFIDRIVGMNDEELAEIGLKRWEKGNITNVRGNVVYVGSLNVGAPRGTTQNRKIPSLATIKKQLVSLEVKALNKLEEILDNEEDYKVLLTTVKQTHAIYSDWRREGDSFFSTKGDKDIPAEETQEDVKEVDAITNIIDVKFGRNS